MPRGDHFNITNAVPSLGVGGAGSPLVGGCQPTNSRRVSSSRALEPRQSSTGCRGDLNNSPARKGVIASEGGNPILHDLSNETRPVFGRHIVVPFFNFAFHADRNSQGARHDLA